MEDIRTTYSKISGYLNSRYIVTQLQYRFKNEEEATYSMPHQDLINIMNIDEYMYRLMREGLPITPGSHLNTYLTEISRQLEQQPLLLLSLPIGKLEIVMLERYLPGINNIYTRIKQKNREANNIFRIFKTNPNLITSEEFKKLLIFFSYTIPYKDENLKNAQEYLAKYLLNNPPNNVPEFYVVTFLIKYFGYKKTREEGITKTKILIANMKPTTRGLSTDDDYAIINKQLLQRVIIRNNLLKSRGKISTSGEELLAILHTMYHEIRHQKQTNDAKKGILNDISFFMGARNVIYSMDKNFDYEKNYKCYETEKDANARAWEDIERLIKMYISSYNVEELTRNILKHKLTEELEQITGMRTDKNNQTYLSIELLIKYLDDAFSKNTSLLNNDYRQFLKFYNVNGTPKRVVELLKMPLIYDFKEFYFGQVSYRSRQLGYRLTERDIKSLQLKEIQTIINNIKILMNVTESKLNKMCDRVEKGQENSTGVVDNLLNDFNFAIYLSNLLNQLLLQHKELFNILSVRNAIASINEHIDMINNNRLVVKTIRNGNTVSKIGRGR